MTVLLALVVGVLYAAAVYLLLRRSIVKILLGLALLSHASNLLMFVAGTGSGGKTRIGSPLIAEGGTALVGDYSDPLPQALILTAIVISFGLIAFALALFQLAHQMLDADDVDALRNTDT